MANPQPTVSFSSQGNQLFIADPTTTNVFQSVVALNGFQGLGGMKSSIKLTNFDSAGYDEYAPGLVDPGKPSGNVILNYGDASHQLLQKLVGLSSSVVTNFYFGESDSVASPTISGIVLIPPKSAGLYVRSGWLLTGFVSEFSFQTSPNNVAMCKLSIQATGSRGMIVVGNSAAI